jgi:sodium/potassium/calcium exchanger 6
MPGGEEEEPPQEYHDEDDGPVNEGSRTPTGQVSEADFSALERAGGEVSIEEDDNEEARKRWLGELSSNMRLSRPSVGSRRNTHTPIRPSLVGALEFRAVLTSLQSSRNIQSIPIGLRRYSDDPTFTSAQQQGLISTTSDPAPRPPYDVVQEGSNLLGVSRPTADIMKHNGNRTRAVSTNDMDNTQLDPRTLLHGTVPSINFGPASPEEGRAPSPSGHASRTGSSAVQSVRQPSPDRLALPQTDGPGSRSGTTNPSALSSPTLGPTQDTPRPSPKFADPGATTPPIPFPPYSDFSFSIHSLSPRPSLNLPSPSASPESMLHQDHFLIPSDPITVPRWWPSKFLPPPHILTSTLFPTLSNWRDKGIWEKLLGVVAAPSVFLLTMTLPVVENQKEDNDDDDIISPSISLPGPLTPLNGSLNLHQRSLIPSLDAGSFPSMNRSVSKDGNSKPRTITTPSGLPPPLISITSDSHILQSPEQLPTKVSSPEPKEWNRWLFIVQTFTAPFFIVLIVWANTEVAHPRALVRPTLYSLTFSLVLLAIILVTTTPSHPPRWRTLLCYLGFAVSIAWISSIANEVVGVLKTLGVVLDMSDAILGLTIFAVGNSLGDFVADITVARLGFPVMALSACFGGPMLNILLGIGISGCYLTIKGGQHRHEKHPDNPVRFKPYHIDISTTLVISGATLLATLVGLLVAVPLRKWKMDRTIGWGLVALWSASTLANVIVEVLGLSSNVS